MSFNEEVDDTPLPSTIAVLSCVHGNMEALEAVLDDVRKQSVDETLCLGDLVGYGPYPNEVIRRLETAGVRSLMGCWDEGIAKGQGNCGCHFISEEEGLLGEQAFAWTDGHISKKTRSLLKGLPFGIRMETKAGTMVFVHGSPKSTGEYLMHTTHDLVLFERAAGAGCDVLVCGHTHVPFVRRVEGALQVTAEANLTAPAFDPSVREASRRVELRPKVIINAGSVGEPRHGGLEATYVVVNTDTLKVEIRKVPYAVEKTAAAMRKRGIPEPLVERLLQGGELVGKSKEIQCAC